MSSNTLWSENFCNISVFKLVFSDSTFDLEKNLWFVRICKRIYNFFGDKITLIVHVFRVISSSTFQWLIIVIELSGVQVGLKHILSYFKIQWAHSLSLIWNHTYDFWLKLHDTKSSYHFVTSTFKSQNSVAQIQDFLVCTNILMIQYWAGL